MNPLIILDYFDWLGKFQPIKFPDSDHFAFETYGKYFECALFMEAMFPGTVWTDLAGDGTDFITNGIHIVNRLSYIITKVPAEPNTNYEVS